MLPLCFEYISMCLSLSIASGVQDQAANPQNIVFTDLLRNEGEERSCEMTPFISNMV